MQNFCYKHWPLILLLGIGILASITNFTPGTFLSGWDTLHPEFNFSLAFQRAIFGVFRPEQGLGAVAAHSQMADLPHILILAILSFVIPLSFLRYFFIFLCFILGGIGMYLFLRHLIPIKAVCFLGALFYMLNIGTVQNFYVPFEMFVIQYASLPFLFLFATNFLLTKKRSSLIGFIITVIFSSPIAFAATLWYVTLGIFLSYLISLNICYWGDASKNFNRGAREISAKRAELSTVNFSSGRTPIVILLLSIMLLLNLYWILPNIYFVIYHGKSVTDALTNQIFSEEAFLYNKAFGNFKDIFLMHIFYFDWSVYTNNQFFPLMQPWINYLKSAIFNFIGFFFFAFALLGIIYTAIKKQRILLSFFPAIVVCLVFLFNDNLPFHFYSLLQKIPLFQEAFRFPDDKILGIFTFIYSIFFGFGIYAFTKIIKSNLLTTIYYLLATAAIIAAIFPIFTGHLISPAMRVAIPKNYFQLFSYLDKKPNGRIATLPIPYLWGWEYYNWGKTKNGAIQGFQGSGFLPFGISQPTMDRDFDRWNSSNETYYREMSYAVYNQNPNLFKSTLKKYNISYILVDTSIIAPFENENALWYPQIKKLLLKIGLKPKNFGNNLYLYTLSKTTSAVLSYSQNLPVRKPVISDFVDTNFVKIGDYISGNSSSTILSLNHLGIIATFPLSFFSTISIPFASYNLVHPKFTPIIETNVAKNDCEFSPFVPRNVLSSWNKEIFFGYIRYISHQGSLCDHMDFPYPLENNNYILQVTARNIEGLSLRICVSDPTTGTCIIYTKLPSSKNFTTENIFVPSFADNKRFAVNIDTIGVRGTTSINDVRNIQVLQIPNDKLISNQQKKSSATSLSYVVKANNSIFLFSAENKPQTLGLLEAYDPGWQLYKIVNSKSPIINNLETFFPFLFETPIGKHVILDNWANGWNISNRPKTNDQRLETKDKYIIVFLPQYLEYFGFIVAGATIVIIFSKFR